ncbi:MAG: tRNA A37 threonylcarbamoyladenosine modification protein TsaB [Verrucomicrobia bacterium]|nr:MAG: tRNA A37 threonylcarbamoyladenosine modification protein TsaB [Verrucomicrobiota bacterium]
MKTLLALEASSDFASVALWGDGKIIASREFASKRSLSADLFPVLASLLDGVLGVETIVVGLGPGSYAGVRITIAAALGLQSVWGCRMVGIPSVAALGSLHGSYQAIGDARRGTWYYAQVRDGLCVEGPLLLESAEHLRLAISRGAGPVRCSEAVASEWNAERFLPQAALLADLAALGRGILQQTDLEPLYLRAPHITVAVPKS